MKITLEDNTPFDGIQAPTVTVTVHDDHIMEILRGIRGALIAYGFCPDNVDEYLDLT